MKNYDLIIASGATICYNKLAREFCHFKSGGKIDRLIKPNSIESLIICLQNTDDAIVFGSTTNSLISDSGIDNDVILTTGVKGIEVKDCFITAMAGEMLPKVCNVAKEYGLSGLEGLCGIPSTIGGAVYMNCGAFGYNISDVLYCVNVYDNGDIKQLTCNECGFGYRTSNFMQNKMIVLSATFKLKESNSLLISNNIKFFKTKRKQSQPNDISLGSVFKKYNDTSAGYYIENCGLKGASIGGAMVSQKHANFIINCGGATSSDYSNLVNLCHDKVLEKYNINLDREVRYFGKFIW